MTIMTQPKPTYNRGDVVLVLFPHSNLKTAKVRPALVIQADNLQTGLPQLIVAMITSRMFRANHPSRVTIQLSSSEGQQSGLLTDSVVMTDNLATVAELEIDRIIGSLSMEKVDIALRHTYCRHPFCSQTLRGNQRRSFISSRLKERPACT